MSQESTILILSTSYLPQVGGSELAIKNITDRIEDFDFDLIAGRNDNRLPENEKIGNVNVCRVGGTFFLADLILPKNFLPLAVFLKALGLFRKNNYKLVHVFQASSAGGAAWLLKFIFRKTPMILTLQEGKNLDEQGVILNFFRRMIIGKADQAVAISRYLESYISKIRPKLPVEIIPNGVDVGLFNKDTSLDEKEKLKAELGIGPAQKIIISLSRLVKKNGLDLLIRAGAVLRDKYKLRDFKILLVGAGPEESNLKKIADELGIGESVIFAGETDYSNLPKYLKIAHVFVRPSRSEGLGSAFLEAMAAGVPVVGTNVGGIPDFLEDGKTGLFCSFEPDDIAFKISRLLSEDELSRLIVKNARVLVESKYSWDIIAQKYLGLYRSYAEADLFGK